MRVLRAVSLSQGWLIGGQWHVKSLLDDVSFDEGFSVKYGKYPENLYSPCLRPWVFARGCLS